jgi:predicted component of type VI protein secretion system
MAMKAIGSRRWRAFAALLWAGLACSSQKPANTPKLETLRVRIETTGDANRGTALHVLVRETSKTDYPRVDYEDVASTLLAESDPKTLDWLVVLPGQQREVVLQHAQGTAIAVYFLFTEPGQRWKALVEDHAREVNFLVGRDQIQDALVSTAAVRAR